MHKVLIMCMGVVSGIYGMSLSPARSLEGIMKTTSLEQKVMDYPLDEIKAKYCKKYELDSWTAAEHEKELKRFLIMAALTPQEKHPMYSKKVDKLWHTFILFTRSYSDFCESVIGRFIHHEPTVNPEASPLQPDAQQRFVKVYRRLFGEKPSALIWEKAYSTQSPDCGHACSTPCDCSAGGGAF